MHNMAALVSVLSSLEMIGIVIGPSQQEHFMSPACRNNELPTIVRMSHR